MNDPRTPADDRLDTWAAATDRPIPTFVAPSTRRRGRGVAILALTTVVVLAGVVVAVVITGGSPQKSSFETAPSAELALTAAQAIAMAPGVHYALSLAVKESGFDSGFRSTGDIDFGGHRFSGVADGGAPGQSMLLFGGPSSGAVIDAGGLFVKTENGPWVAVPGGDPQVDAFMQPARLSNALVAAVQSSAIDPEIRSARCGTATCRQVGIALPKPALFALETALFGGAVSEPPPDLGPIVVQLLIDPSTGFLTGLETQTTAGATSIHITLGLTRLDPAPSIAPPLP